MGPVDGPDRGRRPPQPALRAGAAVALACAALLLSALSAPGARAAVPAQDWPWSNATKSLQVVKTSGLELDTEPAWLHLHTDTAPSVGLTVKCWVGQDPCRAGLPASIRYTAQGLPLTGWLAWSRRAYTLPIGHPMLSYILDGVVDVSVEVSGSTRFGFKPWPAFLHLKRGLALGPLRAMVNQDDPVHSAERSPGALRVDIAERRAPGQDGFTGYPANASVSPWRTPPYSTDLYMEHLTPGSGLFQEQPMWWEDLPSHPGLLFIRGLQPYQGEDARFIDHSRLPAADGPRGIGWVSPYLQGSVDSAGRLVFAETLGRVGWLLPTGEIYTLAGWVTAAGKAPVWVRKDVAAVRLNQELRGNGAAFRGGGGFGQPMDAAFDRADPSVIFVPDLKHHCIWRLRLNGIADFSDLSARPTSVDVDPFSGDCSSAADGGAHADGPGAAARYNAPFSAVVARGALFVSDSANHAIRKVNLGTGAATTLWGDPGFTATLTSRGVTDLFSQERARAASRVVVSPAAAAGGARPEIYWPSALRATSSGQLVLLEHGFGQIRKLDPDTNVASVLANVSQKFAEFDHGWAWLDVDVTGATGPVDGVWWCKAVGETIDGDTQYHFNEVFAWTPPEGGGSRFVFTGRGGEADPVNWGDREHVTPPHYPWLVAVDPRGAVLVAGMGTHGVSRVRMRDPGDPTVIGDSDNWDYYRGRGLYNIGAPAGPLASTLTFRFGGGAHNILGLRSGDAWGSAGLDGDALLRRFGVAPQLLSAFSDSRTCVLAFLRRQSGPDRDRPWGFTPAAADASPPTAPGGLSAAVIAKVGAVPPVGGVLLRWTVSSDDVAVSGYTLQVALDEAFTVPAAGHFGVLLGNTDAVLLEGLKKAKRHWARIRAADLAGNQSPWSAVASFTPA